MKIHSSEIENENLPQTSRHENKNITFNYPPEYRPDVPIPSKAYLAHQDNTKVIKISIEGSSVNQEQNNYRAVPSQNLKYKIMTDAEVIRFLRLMRITRVAIITNGFVDAITYVLYFFYPCMFLVGVRGVILLRERHLYIFLLFIGLSNIPYFIFIALSENHPALWLLTSFYCILKLFNIIAVSLLLIEMKKVNPDDKMRITSYYRQNPGYNCIYCC